MDIMKEMLNFDVIGIDEGQFFPDIFEACMKLDDAGKIVIVATLSANYFGEPFKEIVRLEPFCVVKRLTAICTFDGNGKICGKSATLSHFLGQKCKEYKTVIGGTEKFIPLCRKHWKQLNKII